MEASSDRRLQQAHAYLERHQIPHLMESLLARAALERPGDLRAFLVEALLELKRGRDEAPAEVFGNEACQRALRATCGDMVKAIAWLRKHGKHAGDALGEAAELETDAGPPEQPKADEPKTGEHGPGSPVGAPEIKALRDRTGASILDAQKALKERQGDLAQAEDLLRQRGLAKVSLGGVRPQEPRGFSFIHFDSELGVMVEVTSETEFMATNAEFKELVADLASQIGASGAAGGGRAAAEVVESGQQEFTLLSQKWIKDKEKTVQEVLAEKSAALGETVAVKRFARAARSAAQS